MNTSRYFARFPCFLVFLSIAGNKEKIKDLILTICEKDMNKGAGLYPSEYVRNGTVSIFCFLQPHTGRLLHSVEQTRTAVDWAEKIKYLVDEIEPEAEKIILIMDNLNTHNISSLYKAFPPEEARRIAKKLEVHYTPKHGSWLDIAEIGINIMTRECLNRRIPSINDLKEELRVWNDAYDIDPSPVNWQFQTEDSRIKLKRLYPDIEKYRKDRDERRAAKLVEKVFLFY